MRDRDHSYDESQEMIRSLEAVLFMALMMALMLARGEQYDGGLQGRPKWVGSQGRR
jgi:hypothetical protein